MPRDRHAISYRPPRDDDHGSGGEWQRAFRFLGGYVLPHRWGMLVGVVLLSFNACAGYLIAYYTQVVVDSILVVQVADPDRPSDALPLRISARDRHSDAWRAPRHGAVHETTRTLRASMRPPGAMSALWGMFLAFTLTLVAVNGAARVAVRLRVGISREITRRLRDDLHQKVLTLSKSYHERHPPGRLLARILSDVDVIRQQLMQTIFQAGHQIVMAVVGLAILMSIEWRLALLVMTTLGPYVWLVHRFQGKIMPISRETRHTNSCMYGYVAQKIDAVRAVMAYGREAGERLTFRRLAHCMFRDVTAQERYSAQLNMWAALLTSTVTLGLFLIGAHSVMQGSMTLGRMLYAYSVTAMLFSPILGLTQLSVVVSSVVVMAQRLQNIMDAEVEIRDAPGAVDFPVPLRGSLSLHNVCFAYANQNEPVLRDISLHIPAGQWVCIMGASGSGKSTLLHLISRLYDPQTGHLSADGIPLRQIRIGSLRQGMALVPQEAQIFTGSVRDNITYGDADATPQQIMAAARAAECHDFIMEMPIQYETLVGERGSTLSGGQRQRISIARALLTQPEVLILDDVTSALDADTERRIQETLASLMRGKTAVVVSQRVSMAQRCHKIFVLAGGVIAEQGTHASLIQEDGFYARLCAQQLEGTSGKPDGSPA
ncbi:MAG: ABC transporter ATP-binding protein [Lentisphaerae bacterium]|nr:ABC transporter ATP-binding protein [Lentisphaerota bacterium]